MIAVNPYLNFKGTTEEAFNFYCKVLGGEQIMLIRYKDTPEADKVSAEEGEKLMHASIKLQNGVILMATDMLESQGRPYVEGTNFYLTIGTSTEDEATKVFNDLSAGGKVTMPLQKTFWGAYFGMLSDKFGIKWMVNYDEQHKPEDV